MSEKGHINRILIYSIVFVAIVVMVLQTTHTTATTFQATILKVSDGDTVWVKHNRKRLKLRLIGIDTPEEYHSKKMKRDIRKCHTTYQKMKLLGLLRTKHSKELLSVGETVTVKTAGRGYYGRTLAWIILPDGINYNEKMVADGYACLYKQHGRKPGNVDWQEWRKLNRLLENAKDKKKGLWREYKDLMECLCE